MALVLAAALHLATFMAAGWLGWDYASLTPAIEIPPDRFLELFLEINEPTVEAAPAPETTRPPEAIAPPEEEPAALPDAPNLPYDSKILEGADEPAAAPSEDRTVNLEEAAPALKSYNSMERTAVARHRIMPPAARSNLQPGRFVAVMTLGREGQVLVIMVEESSGIPALDFAAMEALRGAAPYPPFPPDLAEHESLNFRLHFDYRAVQRRPGSPRTYDRNPD